MTVAARLPSVLSAEGHVSGAKAAVVAAEDYSQRNIYAARANLMHTAMIRFVTLCYQTHDGSTALANVDPITRREFWTHITGLVGKGVTVLVTTHFMDEAEYCDRVALVNRAQLIALDTPDGLKAMAADESLPDPTMEQAFIRLIERQNALEDEKGRAA